MNTATSNRSVVNQKIVAPELLNEPWGIDYALQLTIIRQHVHQI
jgi:hypothetical protein